MLPYWTAPLAAAIGNLLIGFGVLWTERRQQLHRVFALLAAALASWNLHVFCLTFFEAEADSLWWSQVFRPGMFVVPAALYHLSAAFRGRPGRLTAAVIVMGYAAAFIFTVADLQGLMISGLRRLPSGYWPVMLPLYSAFIGVALLSFVVFLATLVHEYRTTGSPRRRMLAKFWLLGAVAALPLTAVSFLPFFGIDVYPVGSLGNLVCTGVFAYAIVHHRLVDTDIVITKGVAFIAGAVLVAAPLCLLAAWLDLIVFGEMDYNRVLLSVVIVLTAAILFPRVTGMTEERLGQTLFREKVEHRKALAAFSRQAALVRDPLELVQRLSSIIRRDMEVDTATVLLSGELAGLAGPMGGSTSDAVGSLAAAGPLAGALARCDDVLVREEISGREGWCAEAERVLKLVGCEVAVPLRATGQLLGCLLIGRKTNRDGFSREDVQMLATLGNATAVALDNSRLSSELEASQQMVARASQLSAVGTLAAGIAHEIRNPLVAVQTFLQLLPERLDDGEFIHSFRRLSLGEIGRIGRLVEELLGLAHSPVHAPVRCNLHALAEDVVTLLAPQARRSDVTLQLTGDEVAEASVDAARIKQVIMNLVLNSIEASPPESVVTVSVRSLHDTGKEAICRVDVSDQGSGIQRERHDDVFTPFFTTKEPGTGLGLAVAHQIVKEHGGNISFTSEGEVGTTFSVILPVRGCAERHALGGDEPGRSSDDPGSETALPGAP